jgi:hypothetical protein
MAMAAIAERRSSSRPLLCSLSIPIKLITAISSSGQPSGAPSPDAQHAVAPPSCRKRRQCRGRTRSVRPEPSLAKLGPPLSSCGPCDASPLSQPPAAAHTTTARGRRPSDGRRMRSSHLSSAQTGLAPPTSSEGSLVASPPLPRCRHALSGRDRRARPPPLLSSALKEKKDVTLE